MLMGAALWATLQAQVSYPAALATVLLGAVAGWCCGFPLAWGAGSRGRGPADQPQPGAGQGAGALLAYRALYYFVPLVLASLALVQQNCAGATVQQFLPKN